MTRVKERRRGERRKRDRVGGGAIGSVGTTEGFDDVCKQSQRGDGMTPEREGRQWQAT